MKGKTVQSTKFVAILVLFLVLLPNLVVSEVPQEIDCYAVRAFPGGGLSVPRSAIGATTVNDIAFFAGGSSAVGAKLDVVDIFDVQSNTWAVANVSEKRSFICAVSVAGKAFFAGGYTTSGGAVSNVIDIYDTATSTWSNATLSVARVALSCTAVGNNLVMFAGGLSGTGTGLNAVDIYNATDSSWTTATLSQARYNLGATSVGPLAIFAGGWTGASSNRVDIYDSESRSWSTSSLPKTESDCAGASRTNSDLAFFFCTDSYGLYVYNTTSETWFARALPNDITFNIAATALGDRVFSIGPGPHANVYNPSTDEAKSYLLKAFGLYSAITSTSTGIFIAGGSSSIASGMIDELQVFSESKECVERWNAITACSSEILNLKIELDDSVAILENKTSNLRTDVAALQNSLQSNSVSLMVSIYSMWIFCVLML